MKLQKVLNVPEMVYVPGIKDVCVCICLSVSLFFILIRIISSLFVAGIRPSVIFVS